MSLDDRPTDDFEHYELTNLIEFKSAFVHLAKKCGSHGTVHEPTKVFST